MRQLAIALVALLSLAGCATSQDTKPATAEAKPAAPAKTAAAPRCYSGDAGKFYNVSEKAQVAGVEVVCSPLSDGKAAAWASARHAAK